MTQRDKRMCSQIPGRIERESSEVVMLWNEKHLIFDFDLFWGWGKGRERVSE